MRFSVVITVALLLALAVLARAATFAQRNLPTFETKISQSISYSKQISTDYGVAHVFDAHQTIRRVSLLRNVNFPEVKPALVVKPQVERVFDFPEKTLVSAVIFQPVRPPSC